MHFKPNAVKWDTTSKMARWVLLSYDMQIIRFLCIWYISTMPDRWDLTRAMPNEMPKLIGRKSKWTLQLMYKMTFYIWPCYIILSTYMVIFWRNVKRIHMITSNPTYERTFFIINAVYIFTNVSNSPFPWYVDIPLNVHTVKGARAYTETSVTFKLLDLKPEPWDF